MLSELKECGTAGGQGNQASCYSRGRQSTKYNRMNSGRFFFLFYLGLFFPPVWFVAGNTIANYIIRLNNLHITTDSRTSLNLVNPGKELSVTKYICKGRLTQKLCFFRMDYFQMFFRSPILYSLEKNCGSLLGSQFKHHLNSSTRIFVILLQLSSIMVLPIVLHLD